MFTLRGKEFVERKVCENKLSAAVWLNPKLVTSYLDKQNMDLNSVCIRA